MHVYNRYKTRGTSRYVFQDYTGLSLWALWPLFLPSSLIIGLAPSSVHTYDALYPKQQDKDTTYKSKAIELKVNRGRGEQEGEVWEGRWGRGVCFESQDDGGGRTYLSLIWGPIRSVLIGLSVTFRMEFVLSSPVDPGQKGQAQSGGRSLSLHGPRLGHVRGRLVIL